MGRRMTSPVMVGRTDAIAQLTAAFASSQAGEPRHVVISGEAGVGKTRLLARARDTAEADRARVLLGACAHLGDAGLPFAPYTDIVRTLVIEDGVRKVAALAGRGTADLARLVPALTSQEPPALQEVWAQSRLQEALLTLFRRLSRERPLILLLEDLHWADAGTHAATAVLMRVMADDPVTIVGTFRSDAVAGNAQLRGWLVDVMRLPSVERLDLRPLDPSETTALVRHLVGGDLPAAGSAELYRRSDGNPFFIEELVAARDDPGALSDSLRDLLLTRVAALQTVPRRWLEIAAVGGRHVEHELLVKVASRVPDTTPDGLGRLIESGLLQVDPDSHGDSYRFRHALLQEAVHETIPAPVRRQYHREYGSVLASRAPEAREHPTAKVELAHHWREARDPRALSASIDAGEAAAAAYSFDVALAEYEGALALLDAGTSGGIAPLDRCELLRRTSVAAFLSGDSLRAITLGRQALDALDDGDRVRATDLQIYLAQILWMSGAWSEGIEANAKALAMAPDRPAEVRPRALAGLAQRYMLHGRYREARALASEAVERAQASGLRRLEGHARNTLGFSLAAMGHGEEGLLRLDEAYAIAIEMDDPDNLARAIENRGDSLQLAGYPDRALAHHLEGLELVRERGLALSYGPRLLYCTVNYAFECGEWDVAARQLAEADRVADRNDGTRLNRASYALRYLACSGSASARPEWEWLQPQLEDRPVTDLTAWIHIAAVELETFAGRAADAVDVAWTSFELLDTWDSWLWTAETARVAAWPVADQGLRARAAGDTDAVARCERRMERLGSLARSARDGLEEPDTRIAEILDLDVRQVDAESARMQGRDDHDVWCDIADGWQRVTQPYRTFVARWREAEALASVGDLEAATRALRSAHAGASRLGAEPLVARLEMLARRLRVRLEGTTTVAFQGSATPFGLTGREREVLSLIASGRTNRQIAEELYISKSTAGVHVSHILAKLGVATRTEAAATAVSQGLVAADTQPSQSAERPASRST